MGEKRPQSRGRKANDALPLGERSGDDSQRKVKVQGRRERRSAGPDGPDAREVGDTFKRPPDA